MGVSEHKTTPLTLCAIAGPHILCINIEQQREWSETKKDYIKLFAMNASPHDFAQM